MTTLGNFPSATSIATTDYIAVEQSGVLKKATPTLLPFLQSGTGAVSRTVQAKLRDVISATDFGAVGDNSTDNATAIQNALNVAAVSGAYPAVILPQGNYKIASGLTIPAKVKLIGLGRDSTIISYTGSGSAITIDGVNEAGARGFRLDLGSSATAVGVDVKTTSADVRWCEVKELEIAAAAIVQGQIGMKLTASGGHIITDNWLGCDTNFYAIDKPIVDTASEGNFLLGVDIDTWGTTNSTTAINCTSNANHIRARVAGILVGTNCVAYATTGVANVVDLIADLTSSHTALNVTGTRNVIRLGRTSSNPTGVGTVSVGNTLIEPFAGNVAQVVGKSAAAVSATADTNEDTLVTVTIPANMLGANGHLRITTTWTVTNNANAKTARVHFSGAAGTTHASMGFISTTGGVMHTLIANRNATASQVGQNYAIKDDQTVARNTVTTSAVDTTAQTTVVITGQKGSAGDTMTLESYLVEFFPS